MLKYLVPFYDPDVESWSWEARWLRWLTFVWLGVGLVVMLSASYAVADAGQEDGLYYFKRQLLWIVVGAIAFKIMVHGPIQWWFKLARVGLGIFLFLIFLTNIPMFGTAINGATRWIAIGSVVIQPSELIKPFLVLQSAWIFGRWSRLSEQTQWRWLGIFGLVLVGILLQPNLSTTALCGMGLWLIALAANFPLKQLSLTAIAGLGAAGISMVLNPYQWQRVTSFLDPWSEPMGNGYQLTQSLMAVGSGRLWGVGFGLSQQKLFYLPIQYTDFIFSIYAEEFGFVGGMLLILMLMVYASLGLVVALRCRRNVERLVVIGAIVMLVGQSLLNIGVATGALPTTGLPLPLFSYGGSSMIASLMLAGLLIRVARENHQAKVIPLRPKKSKP